MAVDVAPFVPNGYVPRHISVDHITFIFVSLSLSFSPYSRPRTPCHPYAMPLCHHRRALDPMAFAKRIAADLLRSLWCPAYCPTGSNNPIRFYESLVLHRLSESFQYRLIAISGDTLPLVTTPYTHFSVASHPPGIPSSGLFHSISRRLLCIYIQVYTA